MTWTSDLMLARIREIMKNRGCTFSVALDVFCNELEREQ